MGYYKVLGSYLFSYSECYPYSYVNPIWNNFQSYGYKIILKDENNTLFILTLKETLGKNFELDYDNYGSYDNYDNYGTDKYSSLGYYSIEECTHKELSNILYKPKDNNKDIIFIIEGTDISNHLFSISKYGNPDEYFYTGTFEMYMGNWSRINNK